MTAPMRMGPLDGQTWPASDEFPWLYITQTKAKPNGCADYGNARGAVYWFNGTQWVFQPKATAGYQEAYNRHTQGELE